MNKRRYIFYIILGLIGCFAAVGEWKMYSYAFPVLRSNCALAFFLASPLLFVLPYTLALNLPSNLVKILTQIGGYWFVAAYYGVIGMIPFFFLLAAATVTGYAFWYSLLSLYGTAVALLIMLSLCCGRYRALHPVITRVETETAKALNKDLKIAFVSDIHLGAVQGKPFIRKLAEKMEQIAPDMILIGGDIIDGNLEFVLRDKSLEELERLTDTGAEVIAVFGNHDHYGADIGEERRVLEEAGIRCLSDDTYRTETGAYVTGMVDYMYVTFQKVRPARNDGFTIFMEHEPVQIKLAAAAGYDLYLAGHTHAGQFWPNRLATKRIFELDFGVKRYRQMTAVVSSGYGSWGPLFRLGPAPEIVLITVKRKPAESETVRHRQTAGKL